MPLFGTFIKLLKKFRIPKIVPKFFFENFSLESGFSDEFRSEFRQDSDSDRISRKKFWNKNQKMQLSPQHVPEFLDKGKTAGLLLQLTMLHGGLNQRMLWMS